MIEVKIFSLSDMLLTKAIKYNKSELAKFLKINRGIINKYIDDVDCERHGIIFTDNKYTFMCKTRK